MPEVIAIQKCQGSWNHGPMHACVQQCGSSSFLLTDFH